MGRYLLLVLICISFKSYCLASDSTTTIELRSFENTASESGNKKESEPKRNPSSESASSIGTRCCIKTQNAEQVCSDRHLMPASAEVEVLQKAGTSAGIKAKPRCDTKSF